MEQELLTKLCEISKEADKFTGEANFRDSIQDIFNNINRENNDFLNSSCALNETFFAAQSLLKQFYNYHYANADINVKSVNITALVKAVTFCADIIASEWNRRVFFLGGNNDILAVCCERQLIWTLMSLTANAVMYSDEKYIGISVNVKDDNIMFSIENCGAFNCQKYFSAFASEKSSLYCVKKIAEKHGGTLLCSYQKKDNRKSIIKLCVSIKNKCFEGKQSCKLPPYTDKTKRCGQTELERTVSKSSETVTKKKLPVQPTAEVKKLNGYISDFLDDRMSPLYTAFCELLF